MPVWMPRWERQPELRPERDTQVGISLQLNSYYYRGTNYLSQLKNEVATSAAVVLMGSGEVSWYFYNAFSNVWGNDAKGVKGLERAFKNQIERHPKYEIWVTVHRSEVPWRLWQRITSPKLITRYLSG
ncbi:unnamed protein product [Cylicocyclus nassatus]|uniref:Uncharacterized protein n=1 Tax=Cylicocyclus nassatus TaxID=53992 RepID=A0AA36GRJ8_CYLNA|nr:unnamed protein product [Cylicocyclus nassatus]